MIGDARSDPQRLGFFSLKEITISKFHPARRGCFRLQKPPAGGTFTAVIQVNSPSLSEVLFLRLARQGDVEEIARPHCLVPWKEQALRGGHYAYAAFHG